MSRRGPSWSIVTATLVLATAGTMSFALPAGARNPKVGGSWSGVWKRPKPIPENGTMTLVLTQNGHKLSGTMAATHSFCLTTNRVLGTIKGSKIVFVVHRRGVWEQFSGTASGTAMSGNIAAVCHGRAGNGNFSLHKP